jgi:hypothetical protein
MDLKKIEIATEILKQIKLIDVELAEYQKLASIIVNNKVKVRASFALTVIDIDKQEQQQNKAYLSEDGSLILSDSSDSYLDPLQSLQDNISEIRGIFGIMSSDRNKLNKKNKQDKSNKHILNNSISDNTAMAILSVLANEKTKEKEALINKLRDNGFKI